VVFKGKVSLGLVFVDAAMFDCLEEGHVAKHIVGVSPVDTDFVLCACALDEVGVSPEEEVARDVSHTLQSLLPQLLTSKVLKAQSLLVVHRRRAEVKRLRDVLIVKKIDAQHFAALRSRWHLVVDIEESWINVVFTARAHHSHRRLLLEHPRRHKRQVLTWLELVEDHEDFVGADCVPTSGHYVGGTYF